MNPANDASQAVCSDGVTIVTTKPSVKNVVLNGAKTDPRLVVDNNGTMWIIWTDITRTIVNSSNICKYVTLEYKKSFCILFFNVSPHFGGRHIVFALFVRLSVRHTVCQRNSPETTEQNFMKLGR